MERRARVRELDALRRELDAWAAEGREATLWWRDDDAERPDAPVCRMLDLAAWAEATMFCAVPPARAVPALGDCLRATPYAGALQHGYAHLDHSRPGRPGRAELGDDRPLPRIRDELASGQRRMAELFGPRFRPVMVPPWNRIGPRAARLLPDLGFAAISAGDGRGPDTPPGLRRLDGHCDIVAWRRGRRFKGAGKMSARLASHLRARRTGMADPAMPTCLLTHVWANDADAWAWLRALLPLVSGHSGGRWLNPAELLS